MRNYCGLDFGTSNSTIGITLGEVPQLILLENNKPTMRSAIFCNAEIKQWIFGQEGISQYLEGVPGRLMMSLKSVLGSSLMNDETYIFERLTSYKDILSYFIRHLKSKAEETAQSELTQVVLGRPVHFHDHNTEKDIEAQNTLETIAREVGFKDIAFQFEPIAAALSYEANIHKEQIALIVDMGGGTSDFTIIRLHPSRQDKIDQRLEDVLANSGIHIAGTDFDQRLSLNSVMPLLGMGSTVQGSSSVIEMPSSFYYDLTAWHLLNTLYNASNISHIRSIQARAHDKLKLGRLIHVLKARAGHHILDAVEKVKQRLSDEPISQLNLDFIEDDLNLNISRDLFNFVIHENVNQIVETILNTVQIAQITPQEIDAIFYTGGSTKIPMIRGKISALFPQAEIIQGDVFGSVGTGLTIDATHRYR